MHFNKSIPFFRADSSSPEKPLHHGLTEYGKVRFGTFYRESSRN